MSRVPGEQEVDSMKSGGRDVKRVCRRSPWQTKSTGYGPGELRDFGRYREQWDLREDLASPRRRLRISRACLSDYRLGDVQLERPAPAGPPLVRELLTGRRHEVTAWSGSQVADNRGFDVDGTRHV
jgi:hypothetical protein